MLCVSLVNRSRLCTLPAVSRLPAHTAATALTIATDRLLASDPPCPIQALRSSLLRLATLPERRFHSNLPGPASRLVQRPISAPFLSLIRATVHQSSNHKSVLPLASGRLVLSPSDHRLSVSVARPPHLVPFHGESLDLALSSLPLAIPKSTSLLPERTGSVKSRSPIIKPFEL